jgi:GntR family transcriptional regulator
MCQLMMAQNAASGIRIQSRFPRIHESGRLAHLTTSVMGHITQNTFYQVLRETLPSRSEVDIVLVNEYTRILANVTEMSSEPFGFHLDMKSGVPVYRQIIDQVLGALASGRVSGGTQLPTVRQVAVDLSINPNTVVRAYRELELRGIVRTQQGIGTFIQPNRVEPDEAERQRLLSELVGEFMARAGAMGFSADEVIARAHEFVGEQRRSS